MIFDCYTQVGPGVANHRTQLIRPIEDTATPEGLIATMDRAGIDRAVTFAPRWVGGDFVDPTYERGNRVVYEAVQKFPNRLIGYARVNPNYGEAAVREVERCFREYCFRGLFLDAEWENFHPGDRKLVYPLVETARAHQGLVMFHSGYCPVEPALFWPVANDFPEVPMILGHLGGRLHQDAGFVAERAPNLYLESSDNFAKMANIVRRLGAQRILFGSNTPFTPPETELYKVTADVHVSQRDRELILGGNAARLHGLA